MKLLAALVSVVLGVAVFLLFLRPWEGIEWRGIGASQVQQAEPAEPPKAPSPPSEPAPSVETEAPQASEPQPKRALLASEQAELERNAALDPKGSHAITPEALTPAAPTKLYYKVKVRDAGTLEVDLPSAETLVIRLDGIEAHAADETCTKEDGTTWPCGAKARAALILLIRSRAVTCTAPPDGETHEFASRCSVKTQDLATWLVRQGWATPNDDAEPDLAEALQAAKSERIGLWEDWQDE